MKKILTLLIVSTICLGTQAQIFSFQCDIVETYPEFPGGDKSLVYYLRDTLQNSLNRKGISASGTLQVDAAISATGKIENAHTHGSINPQVDAEAIRLIANMPRWAPAIQNGKSTACNVVFRIDVSGNATMQAKATKGIEVKVTPENKTEGSAQTLSRLAGVMQDYLLQLLPETITNNSFNGSVEVRFGMYPDGWVGRIKVLKGGNTKLEEAVSAAIYTFNSELAGDKANFQDELMKTFVAKVNSTK